VAPLLVLFDLDDTLCDYTSARRIRLRLALSTALESAGIDHPDLDRVVDESIAIHPHASDHFPELLERHGVRDPDLHDAARRWFHQNRFYGLELFPGALAALRSIRAHPNVARVGIVSNGPSDVQHDKIALLQLGCEVDFAIISGDVGCEKPHPGIFGAALIAGGSQPDQTLFVGDSEEFDMVGAKNAGLTPLWINRTGRPWQLPGAPPPHTISDLSSVLELLD
jgi:HAD superfamily hydrolase (TIGR01549 family)